MGVISFSLSNVIEFGCHCNVQPSRSRWLGSHVFCLHVLGVRRKTTEGKSV